MKIADISVSRIHAYIRLENGVLKATDNGSKFGTLMKIKRPFKLYNG